MNKKLLIILATISIVGTNNNAKAMHGIQSGKLEILNTLDEQVDYKFTTILNGTDPATHSSYNDCSSNGNGLIPANEKKSISSSFVSNGSSHWGATIEMLLKSKSHAETTQTLQQLGTYLILINEEQKKIELVKQDN